MRHQQILLARMSNKKQRRHPAGNAPITKESESVIGSVIGFVFFVIGLWSDFGTTLGRLCDDFGTIFGRL